MPCCPRRASTTILAVRTLLKLLHTCVSRSLVSFCTPSADCSARKSFCNTTSSGCADNVDLGTACGKLHRVSVLVITDPGAPLGLARKVGMLLRTRPKVGHGKYYEACSIMSLCHLQWELRVQPCIRSAYCGSGQQYLMFDDRFA